MIALLNQTNTKLQMSYCQLAAQAQTSALQPNLHSPPASFTVPVSWPTTSSIQTPLPEPSVSPAAAFSLPLAMDSAALGPAGSASDMSPDLIAAWQSLVSQPPTATSLRAPPDWDVRGSAAGLGNESAGGVGEDRASKTGGPWVVDRTVGNGDAGRATQGSPCVSAATVVVGDG